ncbi:MAG: SxtJ family membrane protein [Methylovirgula sp.]
MQTHETVRSFRKTAAGSNRKFGVTLGLVLAFLAFWPLVHHHGPRWWLLAIALCLGGAGVFFPAALGSANRAWFKLGLALNTIVSPIVMGVLFFGAVAPVGFVLRKRGEDLLGLKRAPQAATFWDERTPPGPGPGTMRKQF